MRMESEALRQHAARLEKMDLSDYDAEEAQAEGEGAIWLEPEPYRPPMEDDPLVRAAFEGDLETLTRLAERGDPTSNPPRPPYVVPTEPTKDPRTIQIGGGVTRTVHRLPSRERRVFSNACTAAAAAGHRRALEWFLDHGCSPRTGTCDTETCAKAAIFGHLDVLQFARSRGCPWSEFTCCSAAENGQLACLEWLHENGCPWDYRTLKYASERGQFDCVKYYCENGGSLETVGGNGGACAQASQHGHLKILKYPRSKGCQWDILSPVYAHQHGKETTFKWIVAQPDCPEFEERDLQSWWNTSHPDNCGA